MKLIVILTIFLITSCSSVSIEHTEGKLPEIKIDSGIDGCKWKPEYNFDDSDLYFKCKWKISI